MTIQTYAWFARHVGSLSRDAYQLVIADEAHTALGEKTSAAIRSFPEPIYIGMTATEQLIAKQVSDVFPASVDDLPLADAARRGLIAPLRDLRVPPAAAIHSVPIVGGDFDEGELAKVLDHEALNQAAARSTATASTRCPASSTPPASSTRTTSRRSSAPPDSRPRPSAGERRRCKLAETLAAYERGEINVLINAMLLAEGWNSPRATVVMHLAPTASKRVYQQRIGRIMRLHPRKEAGIVVDFVHKSATHNDRVVSLHSLLDSDFYREGARVTPAPRRRHQRRARRYLTPAPWLVPVTPDVRRRLAVIQREWQRIDPKYLDEDEQRYWATIAGRNMRFEDRTELVRKFTDRGASKGALAQFLSTCAAENPNRRLRMIALSDRVSTPVERADFDDLVTLVTQAPTWEKDRLQGIRVLLRAIATGMPTRPSRSSRAGRGSSPARRARRRTGARAPSSPRRSGSSARSRTRAGTVTRRTPRGWSTRRWISRSRSALRSSRRRRATRRARTSCSTRPARSSARSRRSQPRSPRTCRSRSSSRAGSAVASGSGRPAGRRKRSRPPRPRPSAAEASPDGAEPRPATAKRRRRRRRKPAAATAGQANGAVTTDTPTETE